MAADATNIDTAATKCRLIGVVVSNKMEKKRYCQRAAPGKACAVLQVHQAQQDLHGSR
jgi:hypothetical protein